MNQPTLFDTPKPPFKGQAGAILGALKRGETMTPKHALERFGCFRLAARIWDLRRGGYAIEKVMVVRGGAKVASYRMEVE